MWKNQCGGCDQRQGQAKQPSEETGVGTWNTQTERNTTHSPSCLCSFDGKRITHTHSHSHHKLFIISFQTHWVLVSVLQLVWWINLFWGGSSRMNDGAGGVGACVIVFPKCRGTWGRVCESEWTTGFKHCRLKKINTLPQSFSVGLYQHYQPYQPAAMIQASPLHKSALTFSTFSGFLRLAFEETWRQTATESPHSAGSRNSNHRLTSTDSTVWHCCKNKSDKTPKTPTHISLSRAELRSVVLSHLSNRWIMAYSYDRPWGEKTAGTPHSHSLK